MKIAAIDDEPFLPQTNLASYGYKITPIGDLKNLSELQDYQIVLCDLMGVGKHFDPDRQGASIIAQVKSSFPEKIVLAYTGAGMGTPIAKRAGAYADRVLKKDIDIDEWCEVLDEFVGKAIDPFEIWNRIRLRLAELQLDTKQILQLEDAYVGGILSKDRQVSRLKCILNGASLREDIKSILMGLISSAIYGIIFGA